MERCENCRYAWVNKYGRATGFSEPAYSETLHCRRYPPDRDFDQSSRDPSRTRAAVEVDRNWWCGEWSFKAG